MPMFRKRPVVIEARVFDGSRETTADLLHWGEGDISYFTGGTEGEHLMVNTSEGPLRARIGDWIIKGIQGELYPCKADVFTATYEQA